MNAQRARVGPHVLADVAARTKSRRAQDSAIDGLVLAGCRFAAIVAEIETRLLACLWIDPVGTYNSMLLMGVCAGEAFAWHVHRDLASALLARAKHFANSGQQWPIDAVARTARDLGSNPEPGEVRGIVESESSAAGALNYSRLLAIAIRRRRQVRRLFRVLRNLIDDPLAELPSNASRTRRKGRAA